MTASLVMTRVADMHSTLTRTRGAAAGALLLSLALVPAVPASAAQPTQLKPGFNVFSAQQDVEIGRQSAAQAERQLPLLNDRNTQRYVDSVFQRLAAQAPGTKFPYQVRIVNAKEINAFALPGGFVYVNRGAITAARTEGELAGVLAHEISHVALRHGTSNATKAYMTQAGLGVLGGILGRGRPTATSQIVNIIGGLGLNAVFLKYSRDAETQADIVGAQIMGRAGYDPMEMANFFQVLEKEGGKQGGSAAQFFSDHPSPANREARIQQEARLIGATGVRRAGNDPEFARVQADLRGMGQAPTMADIQRGAARGQRSGSGYPSDNRYPSDDRYPTDNRYPSDNRNPSDNRYPSGNRYPSDDRYPSDNRYPSNNRYPGRGIGRVDVEPPSNRYVDFRQRDDFFEMQIPSNWRAYEAQNGFGVTIAPEGGIVDQGNGQDGIVYGVIVNHYEPFEGSANRDGNGRGGVSLDQATNDIVNQIRQSNSYLRATSRGRRETIDGARGLSTVLSGTSPLTGEEERVTLVTREMGDGHVLYTLLIAPGRDYGAMSSAFNRMVQPLRVNDEAAHASNRQ